MECCSFTSDGAEDERGHEQDVDADDDVGDELVGQLRDQLVLVCHVVLLTLQLGHVLAEQAARDEVGERLEHRSGNQIRPIKHLTWTAVVV